MIKEVTIYYQPDTGRLSFQQGEQIAQMKVTDDVHAKLHYLFCSYTLDDEEDALLFLHECSLLFDKSSESAKQCYEHQFQAAICVLIAKNGPCGLFQRQNINLFHPKMRKGSHVYRVLFVSLSYCRKVSKNPHLAPDWFCLN